MNQTDEYLESKGCTNTHIKDIKVKYSLLNRILSYRDWSVAVNLLDRLEYTFTYKNGAIELTGLNNSEKFSKDTYVKKLKQLEDGEICIDNEILIGEESENILSENAIKMTIKDQSLSNIGVTIILSNLIDEDIMYGEEYVIEYEKDGTWYKITPIIDNYGFKSIGYILKPKEKREIAIDWEWLYGRLVPGNYRIIKEVFIGKTKEYVGSVFIIK